MSQWLPQVILLCSVCPSALLAATSHFPPGSCVSEELPRTLILHLFTTFQLDATWLSKQVFLWGGVNEDLLTGTVRQQPPTATCCLLQILLALALFDWSFAYLVCFLPVLIGQNWPPVNNQLNRSFSCDFTRRQSGQSIVWHPYKFAHVTVS